MPLTTDDKKYLKHVGLRLRQMREQLGWTLEQTEEHGWHRGDISRELKAEKMSH